MKKDFTTTISVVICVLLVVNLVQIHHLKQEMVDLRANMRNEIRAVSNNVSSISGNIRSVMEEEQNLLTTSQWRCGEVDVEKKTVEVICTVVPKEYTPSSTRASILCNGQEWEMAYQDSEYIAKIEVPLFARSEVTQVKLNDQGAMRTQLLDWVIEPRYEALLNVSARIDFGNSHITPEEQGNVWYPAYLLAITVEQKGEFALRSVEVVEVLDGKEIERIPVDLSEKGQQAYREAASKDNRGASAPEPSGRSPYEGAMGCVYWLDQKCNIPEGGVLELYVDVVDENGLRYRSFVDYVAPSITEGDALQKLDEMRMYSGGESMLIFDEAGNVVYELESDDIEW